MKTSAQVIRVSAARVRDSVPSLSSWLDSVQVRPLGGATTSPAEVHDEPTASDDDTAVAEFSSFVSFKIL